MMTDTASGQMVLFARAQRERILDALEHNNARYLKIARGFARRYALQHGLVTIDDVRRKMREYDFPLPEEVHIDSRVLGAVFRSPEFSFVERRLTERVERIARSGKGSSFVCVYALNGRGLGAL